MSRTINRSGKGGVLITQGFDDLIAEIKKAEGNIEQAAWDAVRAGGREFCRFEEYRKSVRFVRQHKILADYGEYPQQRREIHAKGRENCVLDNGARESGKRLRAVRFLG